MEWSGGRGGGGGGGRVNNKDFGEKMNFFTPVYPFLTHAPGSYGCD